MRMTRFFCAAMAIAAIAGGATACKKHEIRDIDPGKAGRVRSLGPESQDALNVSDLMVRSLLASDPIVNHQGGAPMIVMLPMENNTRQVFNQDVFTSLLKAQLNKDAMGKMRFVGRDIMADIQKEREMKRAGEVDYVPEKQTQATIGADFFLKGRADGLSNVSTKGQSEFIVYTFKLVDAESGLEVWEDVFQTKKEGKDDLIYR